MPLHMDTAPGKSLAEPAITSNHLHWVICALPRDDSPTMITCELLTVRAAFFSKMRLGLDDDDT